MSALSAALLLSQEIRRISTSIIKIDGADNYQTWAFQWKTNLSVLLLGPLSEAKKTDGKVDTDQQTKLSVAMPLDNNTYPAQQYPPHVLDNALRDAILLSTNIPYNGVANQAGPTALAVWMELERM